MYHGHTGPSGALPYGTQSHLSGGGDHHPCSSPFRSTANPWPHPHHAAGSFQSMSNSMPSPPYRNNGSPHASHFGGGMAQEPRVQLGNGLAGALTPGHGAAGPLLAGHRAQSHNPPHVAHLPQQSRSWTLDTLPQALVFPPGHLAPLTRSPLEQRPSLDVPVLSSHTQLLSPASSGHSGSGKGRRRDWEEQPEREYRSRKGGPPKAKLGGPGGKTYDEMLAEGKAVPPRRSPAKTPEASFFWPESDVSGGPRTDKKDEDPVGTKTVPALTPTEVLQSQAQWRGKEIVVGVPVSTSWAPLIAAAPTAKGMAQKENTILTSEPIADEVAKDSNPWPAPLERKLEGFSAGWNTMTTASLVPRASGVKDKEDLGQGKSVDRSRNNKREAKVQASEDSPKPFTSSRSWERVHSVSPELSLPDVPHPKNQKNREDVSSTGSNQPPLAQGPASVVIEGDNDPWPAPPADALGGFGDRPQTGSTSVGQPARIWRAAETDVSQQKPGLATGDTQNARRKGVKPNLSASRKSGIVDQNRSAYFKRSIGGLLVQNNGERRTRHLAGRSSDESERSVTMSDNTHPRPIPERQYSQHAEIESTSPEFQNIPLSAGERLPLNKSTVAQKGADQIVSSASDEQDVGVASLRGKELFSTPRTITPGRGKGMSRLVPSPRTISPDGKDDGANASDYFSEDSGQRTIRRQFSLTEITTQHGSTNESTPTRRDSPSDLSMRLGVAEEAPPTPPLISPNLPRDHSVFNPTSLGSTSTSSVDSSILGLTTFHQRLRVNAATFAPTFGNTHISSLHTGALASTQSSSNNDERRTNIRAATPKYAMPQTRQSAKRLRPSAPAFNPSEMEHKLTTSTASISSLLSQDFGSSSQRPGLRAAARPFVPPSSGQQSRTSMSSPIKALLSDLAPDGASRPSEISVVASPPLLDGSPTRLVPGVISEQMPIASFFHISGSDTPGTFVTAKSRDGQDLPENGQDDQSQKRARLRPTAADFVPSRPFSTLSRRIKPPQNLDDGQRIVPDGFTFAPSLPKLRPTAAAFVPLLSAAVSSNSKSQTTVSPPSNRRRAFTTTFGPPRDDISSDPSTEAPAPCTTQRSSEDSDSSHNQAPGSSEGALDEPKRPRRLARQKTPRTSQNSHHPDGIPPLDSPRLPDQEVTIYPSRPFTIDQVIPKAATSEQVSAFASALSALDTLHTPSSRIFHAPTRAAVILPTGPTPVIGGADAPTSPRLFAGSPPARLMSSPVRMNTANESDPKETPFKLLAETKSASCPWPEIKINPVINDKRFREWVFPLGEVDEHGRRPSISRRHTLPAETSDIDSGPKAGVASTLGTRLDDLRISLAKKITDEGNDESVSRRTSVEFPMRPEVKTLKVINDLDRSSPTPLLQDTSDSKGAATLDLALRTLENIESALRQVIDASSSPETSAFREEIKAQLNQIQVTLDQPPKDIQLLPDESAQFSPTARDKITELLERQTAVLSELHDRSAVQVPFDADDDHQRVREMFEAVLSGQHAMLNKVAESIESQRPVMDMMTQIASAQDNLASQWSDFEAVRERNRIVEQEHKEANGTMLSLQVDLDSMKKKLATTEVEKRSTKLEVDRLSGRLTELQSKASELQGQIDELTPTKMALERERNDLAKALRESHEENEKLSMETEAIRSELARERQKAVAAAENHLSLGAVSSAAHAFQEEILARISRLDDGMHETMGSRVKEYEAVLDRNKVLQSQVDELSGSLGHAKTELGEVQTALVEMRATATSENGELQARLDAQRSLRETAEQRIERLEEELKQARAERENTMMIANERAAWAKMSDLRLHALNQETVYWRQFALESDRKKYKTYLASQPFTSRVTPSRTEASPPDTQLKTPGDGLGGIHSDGVDDGQTTPTRKGGEHGALRDSTSSSSSLDGLTGERDGDGGTLWKVAGV